METKKKNLPAFNIKEFFSKENLPLITLIGKKVSLPKLLFFKNSIALVAEVVSLTTTTFELAPKDILIALA